MLKWFDRTIQHLFAAGYILLLLQIFNILISFWMRIDLFEILPSEIVKKRNHCKVFHCWCSILIPSSSNVETDVGWISKCLSSNFTRIPFYTDCQHSHIKLVLYWLRILLEWFLVKGFLQSCLVFLQMYIRFIGSAMFQSAH